MFATRAMQQRLDTGDSSRKPSSGMSSRRPEWAWQLHRRVAPNAIPFVFGKQAYSSLPPDINGATCVAVDFGSAAFLITADHVVAGALAAREQVGRALDCQFGNVDLNLDAAHVQREPSLDLATIEIGRRQLAAIEREHFVVRPDTWPPLRLALNDPVLFIGYPKSLRIVHEDGSLDFRSGTKLGLVHRFPSRDRLLIQLDPAFVDSMQVGVEEAVEDEIGGYSGGPGFLVRHEPITSARYSAR